MARSRLLRSGLDVLAQEGPLELIRRGARHLRKRAEYGRWVKRHGALGDGERREMAAAAQAFTYRPLISVLMPVYDTEERWLRAALESVRRQVYPRWELCVADDASTQPRVREVLGEYAASDPRIRVVYRERNGHISAASNSALGLASGEFTALLDHDDELSEDALFHVAEVLQRQPRADILYSDEDKKDARGRRVGGYFKSDWNPDLFLSQNMISHLGVYRTELVRRVGGFREGFEGSQDYDLALRVLESTRSEKVVHIPRVLYHWRMIRGSAARDPGEKDYTVAAAVRALQSHLDRACPGAVASPGFPPFFRVRYPLPAPAPRVSVIVAGQAQVEAGEHAYPGPVDWTVAGAEGSAEGLNQAAAGSSGKVLVFVGAGLRPCSDEWLRELVSQAARPEIGVAGGRILDPRGRVQHAGYFVAPELDPPMVSAHAGLSRDDPGHMGRNQLVQGFLAVSRGCLAMRAALFKELGGFDATAFPRSLHDVDLCLRARERGYRVLWTPHAELRREGRGEAAPPDRESTACFRERWARRLPRDPFLHPALKRGDGDFTIAA